MCQIEVQINRNKDVKAQLEKNWSDKHQSFQIDTINLGLNIQAPTIMSHTDVIKDSEKYDRFIGAEPLNCVVFKR